MKKDTLLIIGIVVLAGMLLINLVIPDPIPLLDEGAMLGALIWLVRQKMMAGEEPRVVDAQSPELDDDYRPGDLPKLNDGR